VRGFASLGPKFGQQWAALAMAWVMSLNVGLGLAFG